ncbi:protein LAX PANICLE 2 [Zea mays]|uniref:protein LAX PANICLE 2 n=1 Tax=Zea mays TaxID=4577 RepID=UPI0004DEB06F|nr:protein LAX PANICLE 2 [Zea mays]|eukprot:XP_008663842.1 protein LAX PANICLE 2 [Zea mays]
MAQDPSRPHRHSSKDTAAQQPEPEHQHEHEQQPPAEILHQLAPQAQPQPPHDVHEPAAAASSSSSSDAGSSWLQLGIGGPSPSSPPRRKRPRRDDDDDDAGPSTATSSVQPAAAPPPQLPPQLLLSLQPAGRPSSSSSSAPAPAPARAVAPPPPAHEAGTWFLLRAAPNQRREEPPLPHIPRSYLRVRDGRMMTVRVVMRYLVNKLGLDDDSQLEITCRGQRLQPTMTLQQVRDTIWRPAVPAEAAAVLPAPGSRSTDHIMTLHYCRS